jgi:K+-dependent Na+/Ca+ exchanger-like protein
MRWKQGVARLLLRGTHGFANLINRTFPFSPILSYVQISLCYLFLGLAIVCDDFFVASLEKLSEVFNLSDDVAGATFMAAGSSAPELATSIVDTFYFQSNVGFGTIVGSAVFNILVIIAASAALSKEDLLIDWRPFTRDVFFYLVCIILLVIFSQPETVIIDDVERQRGVILWWEALILIVWYLLYVAFMANNEKFMGMMGGGKNAVQPVTTARTRSNNANGSSAVFEVSSSKPKTDKVQAFDNDINNDDAEIKPERISPTTVPVSTAVTMPGAAPGAPILEPGYEAVKAPAEDTQVISAAEPVSSHPSPTGPMMNAFSDEESGGDEKKSCLDKVIACFSAPWTAIFTVTIPVITAPCIAPLMLLSASAINTLTIASCFDHRILCAQDCAKEKWEKYYVATFTISCFWIGVISWLLVFCATNFGCIVGINPIVMGVTILAGGTSIPGAEKFHVHSI